MPRNDTILNFNRLTDMLSGNVKLYYSPLNSRIISMVSGPKQLNKENAHAAELRLRPPLSSTNYYIPSFRKLLRHKISGVCTMLGLKHTYSSAENVTVAYHHLNIIHISRTVSQSVLV
jgi:hypothetical protein